MNLREKIYNQIPFIHCKGKCYQACGIIAMSETEMKHLKNEYPDLDFTPDGFIERAKYGCLDCPALIDKRCSIYKDRPLVCRLYGVVKKMKCEHGCKPSRYLPETKARQLIDRMDEIDAKVN